MKKIISYIIGIIGLIIPVIIGIYIYQNAIKSYNTSALQIIDIYIGKNKWSVEVATTDEQKMTGLMNRPKLDYNKGMLFVREDDMIRNFWMKDTMIPLDIIYISSGFQIVKIVHGLPYDLTPLSSDRPARYVLELNAGQTAKYNITVGDKVYIKK